jgi:hypothetical protein
MVLVFVFGMVTQRYKGSGKSQGKSAGLKTLNYMGMKRRSLSYRWLGGVAKAAARLPHSKYNRGQI